MVPPSGTQIEISSDADVVVVVARHAGGAAAARDGVTAPLRVASGTLGWYHDPSSHHAGCNAAAEPYEVL